MDNDFGIELGNREEVERLPHEEAFAVMYLRDMGEGTTFQGEPILGIPYEYEYEDKITGEKNKKFKVNLDLIDEFSQEYLRISLNLKKADDNIDYNVYSGSLLYSLLIGIMESNTPGISEQYNKIEKADLSKIRKFLDSCGEMKVKIIENSFTNNKGEEQTYESFKVLEVVPKDDN